MSTTTRIALIGVAALLLWAAAEVVLVAFAGVLLAVSLRGSSSALGKRLGIPAGAGLALVVAGIVLLGGICFWFLAPRVFEQVDRLGEKLPESLNKLREAASAYGWSKALIEKVTEQSGDIALRESGALLAGATGILSTTFGMIAGAFLALVIGAFLSIQPRPYVQGIAALFPADRRDDVVDTLGAVGRTLQWWVLGKCVSMVAVGISIAVGLWLLDVPLALTLGLLAAVATFVPNFGPLISVLAAALLALTVDPMLCVWVIVLFVAVQLVESYLLTPVVNRETIDLPPALTIVMQLLFAVLFGPLGLLLAAPATAAAIVFVKRLHVEKLAGS